MNKLVQACELSLNDWSATFCETIPEPIYSEKYKKWRKKLFNKMRNDRYHKFTTKTVKVMWIAAIISMMLLTAFVTPSSREYILDNLDEFSRYKITENNKNSVAGEITVGYIPDGFKLTENLISDKQIISIYHNIKEEIFTIVKGTSSIKVEFDTENFKTEEITIDDTKYIYCMGNTEINSVVWTKNDYVYQIDAPFEKEELLKIAKNVN